MNYILFDEPEVRAQLLPLTFTRPVCEIRPGIMTIREKWESELGEATSVHTERYLSGKYPISVSVREDNIWINGSILPSSLLVKAVKSLKVNEMLVTGNSLIAKNSRERRSMDGKFKRVEFNKERLLKIERLWDIFVKNGDALKDDFQRLCHGRKSAAVSKTNTLLGKDIFIEKGAKLECAIINSGSGPVYIGKDCEIMEGAVIKGPVAVCSGAVIKAGAKIYGPTTIGPYSKVGGEVNNSVIFGYSNKAHDGFLGNSVIGEWCNLGADTNNSNLKNNYSEVKMWSYKEQREVETGLTFCGLIMGDHSKCGINTMFNTGTVVGVSANIFGAGFPKKHIPSFSWGGAGGTNVYRLADACETAQRVFERRKMSFGREDRQILSHLHALTIRQGKLKG
ncbi:MAG: glucose-1-phosphate thymidylyltransferase [Bacteroidia bacterium]|nr:glucose-1-phosphate thymidylyltransferase [Bacteroidia bacterium]